MNQIKFIISINKITDKKSLMHNELLDSETA